MKATKKIHKKLEKSEVVKQNQDFPNIPAFSDKINHEKTAKKEIHESSEIADQQN